MNKQRLLALAAAICYTVSPMTSNGKTERSMLLKPTTSSSKALGSNNNNTSEQAA